MTEPIRVMVVDDHAIVREGLRWLLSTEPGMTLVGEAADGIQAVERFEQTSPDVVLMDLVMPLRDGITAISQIRGLHPNARILVFTSYADDERIFSAIKAGAMGYLLKDASPQALLRAIRDVYDGIPSMHPVVARKLISELQRPVNLPPTTEPLTEREVEVLKLVAQGLPNEEISARLFIAERTARTHVSNILSKLHLANRTQAALYALRAGFAHLDDV